MAALLRVLTDENGWNDYRTFLAQFRQAAMAEARASGEPALGNITISESTYERWYAGLHTPQNDAKRVLARMFGRSIVELLAEAPAHRDPASRAPRPEVYASALHTEPTPNAGDLSWMERHAKMAARRAIEFAMGAEHNGIGRETMAYLEEEVRRIAGVYNRVPLGTVLDDLIELQDRTFRLIDGDRAKPTQVRDLYLFAAVSSSLLAKASHDMGDPHSAMRQARAAAVFADQAEHPGMVAWVDGLKSLISYWAGRGEDALHYARHGARAAATTSGTVAIWLAGLEGRAGAVLGDHQAVTAAAIRGEELRERTTPDLLDELGGLFTFPLIRQRYYEVEAAVLIGEPGPTLVRRAHEAVQGYADPDDPHWAFGDQAGTHTDLALAHLFAGELDGAVEAVRPVLELPQSQRNAGILASIARVGTALTTNSYRSAPDARTLREEITAFTVRPPLALPR